MAVAIQVPFELSAAGESLAADMTLVAGLVLCGVPYQEFWSQKQMATHWTSEATLVLSV